MEKLTFQALLVNQNERLFELIQLLKPQANTFQHSEEINKIISEGEQAYQELERLRIKTYGKFYDDDKNE